MAGLFRKGSVTGVGGTQVFPNGTRYGEYRIGGTSLASPLMPRASRTASFNPALYLMLGTSAVHDVRPLGQRIAEVRTDYVNGVNDAPRRVLETGE